MKLTEVGIKNYKSATILNESWQQLTEAQQVYVGRWETRVWPLMEQYSKLLEAELTPNQIQQIFQNAEQVSVEGGKNMTALGKAGKVTSDVAGKMKDEIQDLLKRAGESGPVKNFDQQYEKIKGQLATSMKGSPAGQKVLQGIEKWKTYAEENPAKSAFIIGAMTSLLAFASGGMVSGAAIGFFLKLSNNLIKGDKLSVALAKGVKGAAIGAAVGGLSGLIKDMVPAEIEDIIIASDGQSVDVSGLEAMDATSIEDLDPQAIENLLKTQNALELAVRSGEGEVRELAQEQLGLVSDKIGELGGAKELADFAGLEGADLEIDTTTTTRTGGDAIDTTTTMDTVAGETITADELKDVGINFDTEPDLSDEAVAFAQEKGIDVDEMQSFFQMQKAMDDSQFLGSDIAAKTEYMSAFTNGEPTLDTDVFGDDVVEIGRRTTSEISLDIPGIDKPFQFSSTIRVTGEDGEGNPVFQILKVQTSEDHPFLDNLDNMSEEEFDKYFELLNKYTGVGYSATKETIVDDFKQKLAQSIGAAATAAAVGGALADKEVKKGATDLEKKESIDVEDLWDALDLYEKRQTTNEIDGGGAIDKKVMPALGKGLTSLARGAQRGVAAIKSGAAKAGKELGQKITVAKMNRAWKRAGEPTDTASIVNILSGLGMSDEDIGVVGTNSKVDLKVSAANKTDASDKDDATAATGTVNIQDLADQIKKAGVADKVKAALSAA